MSLVGFTLLGSLEVPASVPAASSIDLNVRNADFTAAMLTSLDVGGGDLRFSSDEAGLTQLACDVYQFNKTSTDLVKVNVPSASSGILIYVWGDNTGASQPLPAEPFGRNSTYTDSVWELGLDETSGTSALDRSGTIDGIYLAPLPLLGPNDGQLFTDDSGAKVNRGSGAISRVAFTKKATVLPQNISAGRSIIACDVSGANRFWNWQINPSGFVTLNCRDVSGTVFINAAGTIPVSTTVQSILHFVFTGTHYKTYINGVLDLDIASTTQIKEITRDVYLGDRRAANTTEFRGEIFHASIKESADDADYINLQNDNQSAVGAWWTATDEGGGGPATQILTPTAIASEENFGTPSLATGLVTVTAIGIASEEAIGDVNLSSGATLLAPESMTSQEVLGDPNLLVGATALTTESITTEEAIGLISLLSQSVVLVSSITSEEIVGNPELAYEQTISVVSAHTGETMGRTTVLGGTIVLSLNTVYRDVMSDVYRTTMRDGYDIRT